MTRRYSTSTTVQSATRRRLTGWSTELHSEQVRAPDGAGKPHWGQVMDVEAGIALPMQTDRDTGK
jgi:hypothetical protein